MKWLSLAKLYSTNLLELKTSDLITPDPEELLQQLANSAALPL